MTSLDMSYPDPQSEAAQVDWPAWLARVLPHVDVFLPSLDEMQLMLRTKDGPAEIARRLRGWGARIAGLKLGDQGLYVQWPDRELRVPCFEVKVVGTTGSGDATIAGFLAGLLRGLSPEDVMTMAVAVGACCCEAADATSGVCPWDEVRQRIQTGWKRLK
jgi:sugar/nucleoside kinase (ribokinase family)